MNWGLGIEHEMQLFHKNKNKLIMFDAQEATCFVSKNDGQDKEYFINETTDDIIHNMHASPCCKNMKQCYTYPTDKETKKLNKDKKNKITQKEKDLLMMLDWEHAGRSIPKCRGLVDKVNILMPEFVTGDFRNRTIQSIHKELIDMEDLFLSAIKRSPYTREKIKKYGPLQQHLCGTLKDIYLPIKPSNKYKDYKFMKHKYKDYVGSYHITLTIPYKDSITSKKFVKNHKDMANQFQWIEPLLLTAYFSPDPDSVYSEDYTQASYRILNVGWGTLAGSNVKKMDKTGITRGNNIKPYWMNGLRFKGLHKLLDCVNKSPPQYRNAISILTSDFRTFGYIEDRFNMNLMDICEEYFNPSDCPKLDGAPMDKPYGMEIRIFDHFPSSYLLSLLKIIVLLSANAKRSPPKEYVYKNKNWIGQLKLITEDGWNASVNKEYIKELNDNLGLKISIKKHYLAYNLLEEVINQLFKLNKSSKIVKLMDETPHIKPKLPDINRKCWEFEFNKTLLDNMKKLLKNIPKRKWIYSIEFRQHILKYSSNLEDKKIKKMLLSSINSNYDDVLYALESNDLVELDVKKTVIYRIKIK